MNRIEVKVLNPGVIKESVNMMVAAARLTQRGHKIKNMSDFMELYNKPYSKQLVEYLVKLPHSTIQKFNTVNVIIIGASRRFLMQMTRHQIDVKFISASLQYSDYSDDADFVVPYEILAQGQESVSNYLKSSRYYLRLYREMIASGVSKDSAAYAMPNCLRNNMIISANAFQWKHMISQRVCRRNTDETRYIMLKIWNELMALNPELFNNCGPWCTTGGCKEGKMSCGAPLEKNNPEYILSKDFPEVCYAYKAN